MANRSPAEVAEQERREAEWEVADQQRRRAVLRSAITRDLGLRYSPARVSLDTFDLYHPAQKDIRDRLRSLDLANLVKRGEGLIFFGPVGTGKDHLLAAMLYRAADLEISARWCNGQDLFGALRDRISADQAEEALVRELAWPTILAISDPIPAKRELSGFNVELLYRLIDRRYRSLKSTWVTLNTMTADEADAKLSAPVFDRLRENAYLFRCFWPSYRIEKRLD